MKPTEFLNEGNAHCPKCDCNTTTTMNGKCKLCGTKKLDEEQVVEQQMLDVAAIFLEAKKQGDKQTMLAAQQKLAELNEVKHFRTTYGWAGGRNEKTGGVHKHPGNKEYTVYCSQCGGEFRRDNKNGFSHCKDHDGMHNYDLDEANNDNDSYCVSDKDGYVAYCGTLETAKEYIRKNNATAADGPLKLKRIRKVGDKSRVVDEEGGRWEYNQDGSMREVPASQAAAHAKANLARMSKKSNPFNDDDEYSNHQTHAKDEHGNVFHEDENLDEVKSGEIANHPWVCRRAQVKATGETGEVIRVCREHTFSQMVPFVTMVWIKLDSGETKEVRQNMVQIAKKTGVEEAKHFRTTYGWAGGRNEKTGGSYKHPEQIAADKKAKKEKDDKKKANEDTSSSCIATAPSGKAGPSGPAGSLFGGPPEKKVKETKKVIKRSSIGEGIVLAEYSTAAQRAEADKSYQEFIAKGGQPKPAPNKKYKEPSPGTGCGGTRVAGRGEAARGGGSGKPGLKSRTGKAAHNPIARPKIVGEDGQLNEYKPKIIPKTMAGGKLNPNHPGNTQGIADQQAAKQARKDAAAVERQGQAVRNKEQKRREAQKAKARTKGQKAKAALGSANPTNPLEKKAKDAMYDVWNAIAPDMMQAIRGGGYDEDEDLLEDPYWIAEVCCDANHMQRFAELSPEEEREILDTLDQKTLARLASDFGY